MVEAAGWRSAAVPADVLIWRGLIIDALQGVADEAFQRTVWFGHSTRWVSSPDEVVCQMADAKLGQYLEKRDNGLTAEQAKLARRFLILFDAFCQATPDHLVPKDVIDDPKWSEVRTSAEALRTSLGWPLTTSPTWG